MQNPILEHRCPKYPVHLLRLQEVRPILELVSLEALFACRRLYLCQREPDHDYL